jgi:DNA invertase Pin-like site-specific DNA recombinase
MLTQPGPRRAYVAKCDGCGDQVDTGLRAFPQARDYLSRVLDWRYEKRRGVVDRLGRSLQDLIGFLSELHALGIDLMLHQQGLDTTTPAGKAMFQMMGVFAEFERAMIRERVKAGLERARAQGKTLGRPTIGAATDAAIRKALKKGDVGIRKIATTLGVGTGTVQRIKAEMAA